MNDKTYLLSFLMMDIYARIVLQGGPNPLVEMERAMDFVEQVEGLMKKRGWGEPKPVPALTTAEWESRFPGKPYPGLREFVRQNAVEEVTE